MVLLVLQASGPRAFSAEPNRAAPPQPGQSAQTGQEGQPLPTGVVRPIWPVQPKLPPAPLGVRDPLLGPFTSSTEAPRDYTRDLPGAGPAPTAPDAYRQMEWPLERFGMNYFSQAREALKLRSLYLRALLGAPVGNTLVLPSPQAAGQAGLQTGVQPEGQAGQLQPWLQPQRQGGLPQPAQLGTGPAVAPGVLAPRQATGQPGYGTQTNGLAATNTGAQTNGTYARPYGSQTVVTGQPVYAQPNTGQAGGTVTGGTGLQPLWPFTQPQGGGLGPGGVQQAQPGPSPASTLPPVFPQIPGYQTPGAPQQGAAGYPPAQPLYGVPAGVGATSGLQGGYRPDVGLPWPGFLTGTAASADASRYFVGPEAMSYLNALSTVPERYQLGPGDTLLLRYWSPTLEPRDVSLRLDERGVITLPIGGTLVARGQTLAQLEATLRRTLSRLINKVDLSLTMKDLRTISVLITGEAFAPGSYQMPAVATLFNALYACGGPSDQGSIRRIQLKRTDGTTHTFDFIRFLEGDGTQDAPLQPGDTIYIPLAESLVAVKGEVQRPAIYELTDKERLRDAVRFAGGTKPSGVVQRVSVDSVKPGIERRQVDANLLAAGDANNPVLYDGDTVEVLSIRPETKNAVDIEGAVDQPSRYAWATGMTVADLLERARGVLEDAYLDRADLYRANPDNTQTLIPLDLTKALQRDPQANVALERRDRLVVYRLQDVAFLGFRRVEASGAVQRPGYYTRADGMHVRDLVLQAGGPLPEAAAERAFLQRRNADGSFGPLINLDLLKAAAGDSDQNLLLQDRDVLAVYTRRQADYTPENVVEVKGAVQAPGTYPRAANMRLKDLLNVAGGLLPNAADSLEIAHARTPVNTPVDNVALAALPQAGPDAGGPILSDGDVVTIHSRQDFRMRPVTVIVKGAVKRPGPYALASETESLSDIVRRAGGLANNAFPQGAQMYRKPELLTTDVQQTLAPRVQALLDMVQQAEYRRALARSDVDKLRAVSSKGSSTPAVAIPGAIAPTGGDVSAATMDQVASKLAGRDLVTPARPLTDDDLLPAGNLSIDLMAAMSAPHTRKDVVLREDDFIDIPEKPTTVTVSGAVMVPSSVTYESGKSLADYLAGAGGLAQDAAKDQILIIRATGQVLRAKGRVKVELGDIILVPTRVMYDKLKSNQSVWDSIISRITGGALVYAVIRSLTK